VAVFFVADLRIVAALISAFFLFLSTTTSFPSDVLDHDFLLRSEPIIANTAAPKSFYSPQHLGGSVRVVFATSCSGRQFIRAFVSLRPSCRPVLGG